MKMLRQTSDDRFVIACRKGDISVVEKFLRTASCLALRYGFRCACKTARPDVAVMIAPHLLRHGETLVLGLLLLKNMETRLGVLKALDVREWDIKRIITLCLLQHKAPLTFALAEWLRQLTINHRIGSRSGMCCFALLFELVQRGAPELVSDLWEIFGAARHHDMAKKAMEGSVSPQIIQSTQSLLWSRLRVLMSIDAAIESPEASPSGSGRHLEEERNAKAKRQAIVHVRTLTLLGRPKDTTLRKWLSKWEVGALDSLRKLLIEMESEISPRDIGIDI